MQSREYKDFIYSFSDCLKPVITITWSFLDMFCGRYMCVCVSGRYIYIYIYIGVGVYMCERDIAVPHHFLLIESNGHEGRGTMGNKKIQGNEMGFLWQTNFLGSWFSPHKSQHFCHPLTNFSSTLLHVSSSLNFKAVAEEGYIFKTS